MTFDEEYRIKLEEVEEIVERYLPREEGYQKTYFSHNVTDVFAKVIRFWQFKVRIREFIFVFSLLFF